MSWLDEMKKKRDQMSQTGIELQITYGCEVLLKELGFGPQKDWREVTKAKMIEDKELMGNLSKK